MNIIRRKVSNNISGGWNIPLPVMKAKNKAISKKEHEEKVPISKKWTLRDRWQDGDNREKFVFKISQSVEIYIKKNEAFCRKVWDKLIQIIIFQRLSRKSTSTRTVS